MTWGPVNFRTLC